MKVLFLSIAVALSMAASAQVAKISFQASGLTCSMCSNSIYKALKKLDFVEGVEADVKTYTFQLSFKPNSTVDFDQIKKKVEGAGFFISSFFATLQFNNVPLKKDEPTVVGDKTILFVNTPEKVVNGTRQVKILDKGFVSSGESKKKEFPQATPGVYHGIII